MDAATNDGGNSSFGSSAWRKGVLGLLYSQSYILRLLFLRPKVELTQQQRMQCVQCEVLKGLNIPGWKSCIWQWWKITGDTFTGRMISQFLSWIQNEQCKEFQECIGWGYHERPAEENQNVSLKLQCCGPAWLLTLRYVRQELLKVWYVWLLFFQFCCNDIHKYKFYKSSLKRVRTCGHENWLEPTRNRDGNRCYETGYTFFNSMSTPNTVVDVRSQE